MESLSKPPSPITAANERHVPSGPLLQSSPEGELEQMREEMSARLNGYGWTDEGRGLVHIPITQAIKLVSEGATPQAMDEHTPISSEDDAVVVDGNEVDGEARVE